MKGVISVCEKLQEQENKCVDCYTCRNKALCMLTLNTIIDMLNKLGAIDFTLRITSCSRYVPEDELFKGDRG